MASKTLTPQEIAGYARQAGFTGPMVAIMTAIAMAESGSNPRAHNPNASTGDNSYGLWQINMLGGMGPARRKALGLASNDQLLDPATNARAAYLIYKQQGLNAWSVYKHGTYAQYLGAATQAAGSPATVPPAGSTPAGGGAFTGDPGISGGGTTQNVGLSDAVWGIGDVFAGFGRGLVWVANPHNWIRIAEGLIGGTLILAGAVLVARPAVQPAIQQAAMVATPVGRVASVAKKVAA